MTPRRLLPLLAAFALAACTTLTPPPVATTFVVVRHGEKASDTDRDPDLSAAGLERAQALARHLDGAGLVAVYTSDYRRTRQTVAPSARAHALDAVAYDAGLPAEALASRL